LLRDTDRGSGTGRLLGEALFLGGVVSIGNRGRDFGGRFFLFQRYLRRNETYCLDGRSMVGALLGKVGVNTLGDGREKEDVKNERCNNAILERVILVGTRQDFRPSHQSLGHVVVIVLIIPVENAFVNII
jgi:hypothetical protein